MGSTFGGLNILSRSLYANQASLDTVGHNIANAGTEGYSRQRVNLVTASPAGEVYGRTLHHSGSGVTVASITRARNVFVDEQLRKESSTLGRNLTSSEALSRLEGIFTEPSETGIQTVLNQFWTSWQTLASQASDSGARAAVAQRGVVVVDAVHNAAQQLKDTAENINTEVSSSVSKINQISANIYKLNMQIAKMEFTGTDHANDLRDSRDLLVDQLSNLVEISVKEDSKGNYKIQYLKESSGPLPVGVTLVDGNGYTELGTKTTAGDSNDPYSYGLTNVVDSQGNVVNFTNGGVKALIDSRDSTSKGIKGYMNSLEKVSQFLLQDFNAVHRSGYGTDNLNGRNFFGAAYTSTLPVTDNTDYALLTTGTPPVTTAPVGGWINALKINPDITGKTDGLAIIAAKTSINNIPVTVPTTNSGSGVPSVLNITGTYNSADPTTNVRIKVASIDTGTSKVSGINYSTDGGLTWNPTSPAETSLTNGKVDLTIAGLTFTLDASKLTAPAVNNCYDFSLSASTTYQTTVVSGSTNVGSGVPLVSTSGSYTGGATPTEVRVKIGSVDGSDNVTSITYSTDGGKNWSSPALTGTNLYSLTLKGQTIAIDLDPSAPNAPLTTPRAGNVYSFTLSNGNNASGDNAILLGKRLKTDTSATLGDTSLDAYYSSMIGALGVQSQDAQRTATNQQLVVDQVTNLRQSTSGVNMDEEMTDMIKFQKGYNAAARVLTAMDEMLDKLINGTGVVGR